MMHKQGRVLIAGIVLAICLQACGKVTDDGTAASSQVSREGQTTLIDAADSGASEKDSGASEKASDASDQRHTSPGTGSSEKSEASSGDGEASAAAGQTDPLLLYQDILNEADTNGWHWQFGYVDDDDIPELFVEESDFHMAGVDIYTVADGTVMKAGTAGSWGTVTYYERTGLIESSTTQMGIIDTSFYEIAVPMQLVAAACYQMDASGNELYQIASGSELSDSIDNSGYVDSTQFRYVEKAEYDAFMSNYQAGNRCEARFDMTNGSYVTGESYNGV